MICNRLDVRVRLLHDRKQCLLKESMRISDDVRSRQNRAFACRSVPFLFVTATMFTIAIGIILINHLYYMDGQDAIVDAEIAQINANQTVLLREYVTRSYRNTPITCEFVFPICGSPECQYLDTDLTAVCASSMTEELSHGTDKYYSQTTLPQICPALTTHSSATVGAPNWIFADCIVDGEYIVSNSASNLACLQHFRQTCCPLLQTMCTMAAVMERLLSDSPSVRDFALVVLLYCFCVLILATSGFVFVYPVSSRLSKWHAMRVRKSVEELDTIRSYLDRIEGVLVFISLMRDVDANLVLGVLEFL